MFIGKLKQNYESLQRLRQIANILSKHGFGFLVKRLNLTFHLPIGRKIFRKKFRPVESPAAKMRLVMEELGTTFVKLGQLLSIRPDMIPPDYIKELSRLQDEVGTFDFREVEKQIQSELGRPASKLFQNFSRQPEASASIAQVHSAFLSTGEKVAVKVQRPGIDRIVEADLNILFYLATFFKKYVQELKLYEPENIVREFEKLARHSVLQTVNTGYAVTNLHHIADLTYLHVLIVLRKLFGNYIADFFRSYFHFSTLQ